jgi:hypothetical protein
MSANSSEIRVEILQIIRDELCVMVHRGAFSL